MIKHSTQQQKELKKLYLGKFYEYEGRLLHATRDFIGYDPIISIPLEMPAMCASGEQKNEYNFVLKNEIFQSSTFFSHFLRAYPRV